MAWSRDVSHGIHETLKKSPMNVRIHEDFMDSKRFRDPQYMDAIHSIMSHKYGLKQYDLVIVSDNNALKFVLDTRSQLFENIPIVFCGINYFKPEILRGQKLITGVSENPSIREVIELAFKQFPKTDEFVVIGSSNKNSENDNVLKIKKEAQSFKTKATFTYYIDKSLQELKQILPALKGNKVILFPGMIIRDSNYLLSLSEKSQFLRDNSKLPIYSFWDHYIGHGIVGGKLINGFQQGASAAKMALEILQGRPVESFEVIGAETNRYVFDHNELARFNLSSKHLPKKSHIINKPPDIRQHLNIIAGLAVFISAETIIIFLLFFNIRRRKIAEKALQSSHETLENRVKERTAELKRVLDELQMSEKKFRYLFESMPDGYMATDMNGSIIMANPAAAELLGYQSITELTKQSVLADIYAEPADREKLLAKLSIHKETKLYRVKIKQLNGNLIDVEANIRLVENDKGDTTGFEGVFRDISTQVKSEEELRRLATIDALTRAENRRSFLEQLESEVLRSQRFTHHLSVLAIDLDHFKNINDTFGHPAGDQALKNFSIECMDALRTCDTVGRIGGEEFAVLLPETDFTEALEAAERIRSLIEKLEVHYEENSIRLTISVGVACSTSSGYSGSDLLKHADIALYKAKNSGRNRVCR